MNAHRLLVVEDDAIVAGDIARLLGGWGVADVAIALTGREALDAVRDSRPDLVIMDIEMKGGMDGIETASRIRSEHGVPFIYLTGFSDEALVKRAKETGPYGYVLKPYRPNDLRIAVEMALHRYAMEREIEEKNRRLEREIEERKRAEAALREMEERYRLLIESSSDSIYVLDREWRHLVVNEAATRFVHMPRERLQGNSLTGLFPGIERTGFFQAFQRVMTGRIGEVFTGEYEFGDGRRGWYEVSVSPAPEGILCISRDITARKMAEEALHESEARYRSLFDNSIEMVYVIELNGMMRDANNLALKTFGYSRDELRSLSMADLMEPSDLDEALRVLKEILDTGVQSRIMEYRMRRKDGSRLIVETTGAMVYRQGKPDSVMGIARDISYRKKTEEALRHSEATIRSVLQNAPVGICIMKDRRFRSANRFWHESFGYPEESVIGKTTRMLYESDEEYRRVGQALYADLNKRGAAQVETRLKRSDQIFRDVIVTAAPLIREDPPSEIVAIVHDITELKRAEEELRIFLESVENSSDAVGISTPEGKHYYQNRAFNELFGPVGENPPETVFVDPTVGREVFRTIIAGGQWTGEVRMYARDGGIRTILLRAYASKDTTGRITALVGLHTDITERKQAEDALRESEERYRTLIETSPDPIVTYDLTGKLLSANAAAVRVYGVASVDQFLSNVKTVFDILTEDGRAFAAKNFRRTLNEGASQQNEYLLRKHDGSLFPVEINSAVVRSATGNPLAFISVIRDITERRKAAEALRLSEERFVKMFQFSPVSLALSAIEDGRYLDVNESFVQLTGFSRDEAMKRSSLDLGIWIDPEDRARIRGKINSAGMVSNEQVRLQKKGGSVITALFSAVPIEIEGLPCMLSAALDVTDRMAAEAALRASREMLQSVFNGTPIMMCVVDGNRHIIRGNRAFRDVTGWPDAGEDSDIACGVLGCVNADDDPRGCGYGPSCRDCALLEAIEATFSDGRERTGVERRLTLERYGRRDEVHFLGSTTLLPSDDGRLLLICLQDISERKNAETALRASEEKFRLIADNSAEDIWQLDMEGRVTYASPAKLRIFGYTPDEALNMQFDRFVAEEDLDRALDSFRRILAGELSQLLEMTGVRKDGSRFPLEVSITPVIKENVIVGVQGIARDITGRRRAEEALRESEEKLRAVVYGSPIPQFVIGRDHRIVYWNRALEAISGIRAEEVIGTTRQWEAFYPDERPCMADLLVDGRPDMISEWYGEKYKPSDFIDGAFEGTDFFPGLGPDGKWLYFTASLIKNEHDEILGAVETLEDITVTRRAEESLRKAGLVVEKSPVVLFRWIAAEGWPVEYVSNNVVQFGYTPEELMSGASPFASIIHPDDIERVAREVRAHTEDGDRGFSQEYRIVARDGSVRWVDDRTVVERDAEGRVTHYQGIVIDITERKMFVEALGRSEKKYRELYENLRDGSATVDREGAIIECNGRFLDMVGYSADEISGMSFLEITPEGWHDKEREILRGQVDVRGYSDSYEKEYVRKDGTVVPVELQTYLVKDADGSVTGYWALVRDITARKRAERELAASEKKYRELADFLPEIIFEMDERGRFTYVNRVAFTMLGYEPEELPGINVLDLFVPEDRERCWNNFLSISRGAMSSGNEYTMLRRDGSTLPVIIYSRAIVHSGAGAGLRGIVVDITEIKRAESALRESEEKFRSLFAGSGDAQILLDGDLVLDCNGAAVSLMGCVEKDDLVGHFFQEFCPDVQPDGEPSVSKGARYRKRVREEQGIRFEWQHRRADGGLFVAEVVLTSIRLEARGLIHATLRDVSERIRLQNEIINIVDMEQQRIGRNLHDGLGQDLTGVAFLCSSLEKRLKELELPEADQSNEITKQVYRVITMVRTLSRELYPPNLVENEISFTLSDFASGIESMFGVTCVYEQDPDLVISDIHVSTQIYYIVREAVNNALRHGNARTIIITLTEREERVTLIVSDDGIGFRGNTDNHAGLGLRIMAYRMDSIHGTFEVRHNADRGVTVICSMPSYIMQGKRDS